jgi:hypothetical protein
MPETPSLAKEMLSFAPPRATTSAFFQEFSDSMLAIGAAEHAPRCVGGRRPCPRVPASPKMYPRRLGILPSQATLHAHLQGFSRSPLTDSNRRPPPYHLTPVATSRNLPQRIWLVSAVLAAGRFAGACYWLRLLGSINAPSSRRESLLRRRVSPDKHFAGPSMTRFFLERGHRPQDTNLVFVDTPR